MIIIFNLESFEHYFPNGTINQYLKFCEIYKEGWRIDSALTFEDGSIGVVNPMKAVGYIRVSGEFEERVA